MITTNTFGKTVFTNGTSIAQIFTYAISVGIEVAQGVIKNTYQKKDADYIISIFNSLK